MARPLVRFRFYHIESPGLSLLSVVHVSHYFDLSSCKVTIPARCQSRCLSKSHTSYGLSTPLYMRLSAPIGKGAPLSASILSKGVLRSYRIDTAEDHTLSGKGSVAQLAWIWD
jgi:hypothetical protein